MIFQKISNFAIFCIFCLSISFRFVIISSVIFDLQEFTIPQIKAKDISFGPYSFSFLAKINILWEKKRRSCLVFFYPDFSIIIPLYWIEKNCKVISSYNSFTICCFLVYQSFPKSPKVSKRLRKSMKVSYRVQKS